MQTTAIVKQRNGVFFLVGLSALGWLLIFWSSENMSSPVVSMMMPMDVNWGLSEIVAVWIMWAVMMGAMMLPSAMPMLVVHRRVAAKRDPGATNSNTWFLIGYVLTWTLFSAVAAAAQWGFQRGGGLSPMLRLQDQSIAGGFLIAAGIFQFTAIKTACLSKCRTPIGFLLTDWRPGRAGALRMGLKHGKYCVGCCWALMMVLFVGGVMSLTTIAALSSIVLFEKLMPRGDLIAKLGGAFLIAWGLFLLAQELTGIHSIV
jgi:predicted metal-binding membrane protein